MPGHRAEDSFCVPSLFLRDRSVTKLGRSGSLVFAARAGIHHCQTMYIQPARLAPRARGRSGAGGERPAGAAAESRTGGSKLKLKLPKNPYS